MQVSDSKIQVDTVHASNGMAEQVAEATSGAGPNRLGRAVPGNRSIMLGASSVATLKELHLAYDV